MIEAKIPKIIVIDDDYSQVKRVCSLFKDDFSCYVANTGESGIQMLLEHVADCPIVICDVKLPDLVGFDVCKIIKADHPEICVLLYSGFYDKCLRLEGFRAYADNFLDKAMSDVEFKLLVRNVYNTSNPVHEITAPCNKAKSTYNFMEFEGRIKCRILDYFKCPIVERNPEDVSVKGMAKFLNTTTRTFQRNIEKNVGSNYRQYFADTRLERSRELLVANLNANEISELLDFSSPSHFSREFKKKYGLTPNKFKQDVATLQQ